MIRTDGAAHTLAAGAPRVSGDDSIASATAGILLPHFVRKQTRTASAAAHPPRGSPARTQQNPRSPDDGCGGFPSGRQPGGVRQLDEQAGDGVDEAGDAVLEQADDGGQEGGDGVDHDGSLSVDSW